MSKLRPLLNAGAFVTVVASEIRDELNIPGVFPIKREFILSDLDNQGFVVSADPGDVNRVVALAAEERRVFVNAVDELASASAYSGCVVRKGDATLAISTGGRVPALASFLREAVSHLRPDDLPRQKSRFLLENRSRQQHQRRHVSLQNCGPGGSRRTDRSGRAFRERARISAGDRKK